MFRRTCAGRGPWLGIALVAILAASEAPTAPPRLTEYPGRPGGYQPEPTADGTWDGTWAFTSVDSKMALWMRTKRSKTEMKLRYESGLAPVAFETDWLGKASYYAFEKPATFEARLVRTTPDRIEGTWSWDYQFKSLGRSETGTFTLYRALDGRTLVFRFDTYELVETKNDRTGRSNTPPLWSFFKASKYQVLWDELLF